MAVTLGLPDDEIDRLLLEAEARLSGNGSLVPADAADAAVAAPAAKTPTTVAAPRAPTAGEQTTVLGKKSEKLSVRVPQLEEKKKVCAAFLSTPSHVFHDESISQTL
jgi:tryptophanyl-tRNA synthetase